jgi:hypothetical protein
LGRTTALVGGNRWRFDRTIGRGPRRSGCRVLRGSRYRGDATRRRRDALDGEERDERSDLEQADENDDPG